MRRVATLAGVTDDLFDPTALTEAERTERIRRIAAIVTELEDAKCVTLTDAQRAAIVRWLSRREATIRQISAAASIIAEKETYRSIATDVWASAFASPLVPWREHMRQRLEAYNRGREDQRRIHERGTDEADSQRGVGRSSGDTTGDAMIAAKREAMSEETRSGLARELEIARLGERLEESERSVAGWSLRAAELKSLNRGLIAENEKLRGEIERLRKRKTGKI